MSLDFYIVKGNEEWFWINITHNLTEMADAVGIYKALWRPEENNFKFAKDITQILQDGLYELRINSEKYKKLNPKNGWGSYESLVSNLKLIIKACLKFPEGELVAHR